MSSDGDAKRAPPRAQQSTQSDASFALDALSALQAELEKHIEDAAGRAKLTALFATVSGALKPKALLPDKFKARAFQTAASMEAAEVPVLLEAMRELLHMHSPSKSAAAAASKALHLNSADERVASAVHASRMLMAAAESVFYGRDAAQQTLAPSTTAAAAAEPKQQQQPFMLNASRLADWAFDAFTPMARCATARERDSLGEMAFAGACEHWVSARLVWTLAAMPLGEPRPYRNSHVLNYLYCSTAYDDRSVRDDFKLSEEMTSYAQNPTGFAAAQFARRQISGVAPVSDLTTRPELVKRRLATLKALALKGRLHPYNGTKVFALLEKMDTSRETVLSPPQFGAPELAAQLRDIDEVIHDLASQVAGDDAKDSDEPDLDSMPEPTSKLAAAAAGRVSVGATALTDHESDGEQDIDQKRMSAKELRLPPTLESVTSAAVFGPPPDKSPDLSVLYPSKPKPMAISRPASAAAAADQSRSKQKQKPPARQLLQKKASMPFDKLAVQRPSVSDQIKYRSPRDYDRRAIWFRDVRLDVRQLHDAARAFIYEGAASGSLHSLHTDVAWQRYMASVDSYDNSNTVERSNAQPYKHARWNFSHLLYALDLLIRLESDMTLDMNELAEQKEKEPDLNEHQTVTDQPSAATGAWLRIGKRRGVNGWKLLYMHEPRRAKQCLESITEMRVLLSDVCKSCEPDKPDLEQPDRQCDRTRKETIRQRPGGSRLNDFLACLKHMAPIALPAAKAASVLTRSRTRDATAVVDNVADLVRCTFDLLIRQRNLNLVSSQLLFPVNPALLRGAHRPTAQGDALYSMAFLPHPMTGETVIGVPGSMPITVTLPQLVHAASLGAAPLLSAHTHATHMVGRLFSDLCHFAINEAMRLTLRTLCPSVTRGMNWGSCAAPEMTLAREEKVKGGVNFNAMVRSFHFEAQMISAIVDDALGGPATPMDPRLMIGRLNRARARVHIGPRVRVIRSARDPMIAFVKDMIDLAQVTCESYGEACLPDRGRIPHSSVRWALTVAASVLDQLHERQFALLAERLKNLIEQAVKDAADHHQVALRRGTINSKQLSVHIKTCHDALWRGVVWGTHQFDAIDVSRRFIFGRSISFDALVWGAAGPWLESPVITHTTPVAGVFAPPHALLGKELLKLTRDAVTVAFGRLSRDRSVLYTENSPHVGVASLFARQRQQ